MSQLSWREVAAPDFSTALTGIKDFSSMFGRGVDQAKSIVSDLDQAQTDRVNKALMMSLAGVQDPTTAKSQVASILAAADPNRVSGASLAAAMGRPDQVISTAQHELGLNKDTYDFDRTRTRQANQDLAQPVINEALALSAQGRRNEAAALLASHPETRNMGVDFAGALRDSQGLASSDQSYTQSGTRFGWDVQNHDEERKATALIQDVIANSTNPESADRYLSSLKDVSPNVLSRVRAGLQLPNFPTFTPDPTFGGGSSGGGGGTFNFGAPQQAVASTLSAGGLSTPVVAGYLGNFHVEGGYDGAVGDGGKARGIAQWHPDRLANFEAATGKPFSQATPIDQANFAIWELNNPEKAGMTRAQAAAIKGAKTPEEAARLIDKFYERSSGAATDARVRAATQAASLLGAAADQAGRSFTAADQIGALGSGNNALRLAQFQSDPREAPELATWASKNLSGVSYDMALGKIREIQAQGQKMGVSLSPAAALDMFKTAMRPRSTIDRISDWFASGANPAAYSGYDADQVKQMIADQIPDPKTGISPNEQRVRAATVIQGNQGQQATASQLLSQALAAREQARAAVQRGGRKVDLTPYDNQVSKASAMLQAAIDAPKAAARTLATSGGKAPAAPKPSEPFWKGFLK